MGPDGAGLGGELLGVCAGRRGLLHHHRQEGQEDGGRRGGGPQLVPRRRAWQGGAHRREHLAQEEEGAVQAQEPLRQEALMLERNLQPNSLEAVRCAELRSYAEE